MLKSAQRHAYSITRVLVVFAGEYIPRKKNAISGGCVPVLSKFSPFSCYIQQILGKKINVAHKKLPALTRNLIGKNNLPKPKRH